jgi:hypothetical protein
MGELEIILLNKNRSMYVALKFIKLTHTLKLLCVFIYGISRNKKIWEEITLELCKNYFILDRNEKVVIKSKENN